jgi:hypothetical protein
MRQKHDMVRAHTLIFNIAAAKAAGDHHRRLQGGLGGNASYGLKYDGLCQSKTGYRPTTVGKSMTSQGWSWDRVRVCVQRHTHGKSSSHSQFRRALIPSRRRHNQKAPPKCSYIMSYTTAYNHTGPGGDFYFAKYGIPVEHPANNLISHNTTEFHGTLVHNVDWDPPGKAKDGKENKEPATKRDTDPPKLPEHRGFRLLIRTTCKKPTGKACKPRLLHRVEVLRTRSEGPRRGKAGRLKELRTRGTRTEWIWMNKRLRRAPTCLLPRQSPQNRYPHSRFLCELQVSRPEHINPSRHGSTLDNVCRCMRRGATHTEPPQRIYISEFQFLAFLQRDDSVVVLGNSSSSGRATEPSARRTTPMLQGGRNEGGGPRI